MLLEEDKPEKKSKASMSTEKSSGKLSDVQNTIQEKLAGLKLNPVEQDGFNHKFDEVLNTQHGDVSVVMRILDDVILQGKMLNVFKGLAEKIS